MNDSLRRRLIELVGSLAVQRGDSTLVLGKKSSYYVDMRRAALRHETGPLAGHVMLNMLEEAGFGTGVTDTVDGLTMGTDPMVTAIMHAAASRRLDVDAFVVRKEAKNHGTEWKTEGPSIEGHSVVILEDTSTTGGLPIQILEAAREAGVSTLAVAVVVGRATSAKGGIKACGVPYLTTLGLEDLGLEAQA